MENLVCEKNCLVPLALRHHLDEIYKHGYHCKARGEKDSFKLELFANENTGDSECDYSICYTSIAGWLVVRSNKTKTSPVPQWLIDIKDKIRKGE